METKNIIVLNASNLQGGGAVQVAVSLVFELSLLKIKENITLVLSSVVARECAMIGVDFEGFRSFHQSDQFGFKPFNQDLWEVFRVASVVFTVFGPLYLWRRPANSIVGFAQPWILYPSNEAYQALWPINRLLTRVKYEIQKIFFLRNSDILIVEAEHARTQLEKLVPGTSVTVVPNALNAVFLDAINKDTSSTAPKVAMPPTRGSGGCLSLGYVGRAYLHKNLSILPAVRQALFNNYRMEVTIKVTLTQNEWDSQSDEFRANIENVGALSLAECVAFYQTLDGVLFPSLLECFSATPLEVMAMGLPLFASNRTFVRDFCGEIPFYFDPLDPNDIAAAVKRCWNMPAADLALRLANGQRHVLTLPTARERAAKIAEILFEF